MIVIIAILMSYQVIWVWNIYNILLSRLRKETPINLVCQINTIYILNIAQTFLFQNENKQAVEKEVVSWITIHVL